MSSFTSTRESFIQELKGIVGLSPDQIFQLLMEREKTNQQEINRLSKKEERKILEFENHSMKKRKHDAQSSPSSEWDKPSSKKVCNQFPNRKSLQDLCTDELVTIFDFIPDFGAFKLARVSTQFNEIVSNNIKKAHLITKKDNNIIERFINVGCFQNIDSLIIGLDISLDLVRTILKNSDNLRVLKISIANEDKWRPLQFSEYPSSSFKKLETLHIKCFNEHLIVMLDHGNLFNLTDLKIEKLKCDVLYFLNGRVNNIKKLYLSRVDCDSRIPTMKRLTHLTLDECNISHASLCSLLVDTLEYVRIEYCNNIETDDENELEIQSEFPFLKTLRVEDSEEFDFTTLFKSKLPNLTDLTIASLTEGYATALSENTSITSLKKLSINFSAEQGALKMLMKSQTLVNEIESIDINVTQIDSNILLDICKNASKMSNLKELKIADSSSSELKGYRSLFTSSHFANLEKLKILIPKRMEDLNYLAQTTYFANLKILHITSDTTEDKPPPENFYSLFLSNTNFNQLRELGLSFLDDSSISHIKSMKNLKTIHVNREKVTGWGLKQLDEWGLKWFFIED